LSSLKLSLKSNFIILTDFGKCWLIERCIISYIYKDLFTDKDLESTKSITTWHGFETTVLKSINSLNNAFTSYAPNCFSNWRFLQPWVLETRYSKSPNKSPTIVIGGAVFPFLENGVYVNNYSADQNLLSFWNAGLDDKNIDKFTGYEVIKLNGVPAVVCF
jgi:hypothetical protein